MKLVPGIVFVIFAFVNFRHFNISGDFGYEKFSENDYFFIWRKKR
jgi:hypothetical protein